jgi:uncharacterized protein YjbJ (UPF0337 family)
MNRDRIEGNWKQFKGRVKAQWGKITNDELEVTLGMRDQLLGRMQQTYGMCREESARQLRHWHLHHQRDLEHSTGRS